MIESPRDRRWYAAHAVWAAIAITVPLFLIFTKQRGDPPIMLVLVPLVLIIWVVGHFVIWVVHWLATSGQRIVSKSGGERKPWPIGLRLAVIGTGVLALAGVFQILMTGYLGRLYPYHYASLWTIMLVIKLVHAACFVGLLLRQQWSRLVSAMLAFGWALLLASQIMEHLPPRVSSDTTDLLTAVVLMVFLFLFGLYLAASRKVKSFFRR